MKPSRYIDHISQNSCWNVKCFQKNIIDKIKTLVTINISFFSENRTIYVIMWKNIVEPDRPQITIRRMRISCWMPEATNTISECIILLAFSRQQLLRERVLVLR